MCITTDYIAGFFDGEGCITKTNSEKRLDRGLQVIIGQATRNEVVLLDIQRFLVDNGIRSAIYRQNTEKCCPMTYLTLKDQTSIYNFLTLVVDKLVVKKEQAMAAIPIAKRVRNKLITQRNKLPKALKLYQCGLSYKTIGKQLHMDGKTMKAYFSQNNMQSRPKGTNQYSPLP